MTKFASGKNAFAISDRSGFRYRYKDMRREWNGALVGRDEFEAKQPQLGPFRKVIDAQALRDARPDQANPVQTFEVKTTNGITYLGNGNWSTAGVAELPTKIETTTALTGQVGEVAINTTVEQVEVSGLSATGAVGSLTVTGATVYTVTVANPGSGNKYYINGALQPTLNLSEGDTYVFNWSAATGHPLRFSTTSDGTHGGGSEYTTGVTIDTVAYTSTITVAVGAPNLFYYCQYHSGMGGQINTP
jgi:hypothetical protein